MFPWVRSLLAIHDKKDISHSVGALSGMIYSFTVIDERFTLIDTLQNI